MENFPNLAYSESKSLYAGAPVEEVKSTLASLDKKYWENYNFNTQLKVVNEALKVNEKDQAEKDRAMGYFSLADQHVANGDWENAFKVNTKIATAIASDKNFRDAVESQKKMEEGDALENKLKTEKQGYYRFDNPKNYQGVAKDGVYKYDIETDIDKGAEARKIWAVVTADAVENGTLSKTEAEAFLKTGTFEGITKEKIRSLNEAAYAQYSVSDAGRQHEKVNLRLKGFPNVEQSTADIKNFLLDTGVMRTYSKVGSKLVEDPTVIEAIKSEYAQAALAAKKKAEAEQVIRDATTVAEKVWVEGNPIQNISDVTEILNNYDTTLKAVQLQWEQELKQDGIEKIRSNDGRTLPTGAVVSLEKYYELMKNPEANKVAINAFKNKLKLTKSNGTTADYTDKFNDAYAKFLESKHQQEQLITYFDKSSLLVDSKGGLTYNNVKDKFNKGNSVFDDIWDSVKALNSVGDTFSGDPQDMEQFLKISKDPRGAEVAYKEMFSKGEIRPKIYEYHKEQSKLKTDRLIGKDAQLKALNDIFVKNAQGYLADGATTRFAEVGKKADGSYERSLNDDLHDYIVQNAIGVDDNGQPMGRILPRFASEKGHDNRGGLDVETLKKLTKDGYTEFVGFRLEATSPTGFVLDFTYSDKDKKNTLKPMEVDAPKEMVEKMTNALIYNQTNFTYTKPDGTKTVGPLQSYLYNEFGKINANYGARDVFGIKGLGVELEIPSPNTNKGLTKESILHLPKGDGSFYEVNCKNFDQVLTVYNNYLKTISTAGK